MDDALRALQEHYPRVNASKFDGILPLDYRIVLNPYLRRLTGRITYRDRLIEISSFHLREYGIADALQTLEHELLHLYLHTLREPSGHNLLFKRLAAQLGIRVFHSNPYPRNQPSRERWMYECPECARMVFRRRLRVNLACGVCCRSLARGAWDERFRLKLVERVRFG